MVYSLQLRFGPYTILAWTAQYVNCHIALKAMFYLLNNNDIAFLQNFKVSDNNVPVYNIFSDIY